MSLITKTINVCLLFSSTLLKQSMTSDVSLYWFKLVAFLSSLFILSKMDLLNLPILFFARLISSVFGLIVTLGLWYFKDMKHSLWPFTRILFATVLSFMFFPSKLICFPMFLFTFLYVVVIESFSNLLYSSFSSL